MFQVKYISVLIFIMLIAVGCNDKDDGNSLNDSPATLKPHYYGSGGSCSYTQDILKQIKKSSRDYVSRDKRYKDFLFYYVQMPGEGITGRETIYNVKTPVLPKRFYLVSYTNKYSDEDLKELKRINEEKDSDSVSKYYQYVHDAEIRSFEGSVGGSWGGYKKMAYNFVDKSDGHCDVDVYTDEGITTYSDVQEKFTLKQLLKEGCEDKMDFVPPSRYDISNSQGAYVKVKTQDKSCYDIKKGYVYEMIWDENVEGCRKWKISFAEDNTSDERYSKAYYLNTPIRSIKQEACEEFGTYKLSEIIRGDCKNLIKSIVLGLDSSSFVDSVRIDFTTAQSYYSVKNCFLPKFETNVSQNKVCSEYKYIGFNGESSGVNTTHHYESNTLEQAFNHNIQIYKNNAINVGTGCR